MTDIAEIQKNASQHHKAGRYAQAVENYMLLIQKNPNYAELYINTGAALKAQGQLAKATAYYRQAIQLKPTSHEAYYNLGNVLAEQQRHAEAVESYKNATKLKPDFAQAYYNLANSLCELQLLDQAVEVYKRVIQLKPDYAKAYNNLGTTLKELGQRTEAIENYRQTIRLTPDFAEAHNNLGIALKDEGRLEEAIESYTQAIKIKPDYATAYSNLGTALHSEGQYDEAIENYEKAIQLAPEHAGARWNRSLLLLLAGRYTEGWKEYEWRKKINSAKDVYPHTYEKPQWNGAPFVGKRLLVHYEQGIGDNLQFVRYLPMVKARGGTVIFETPKSMYGLLKNSKAIDELIEKTPGSKPNVDFDLYVSLMDLPRIFETTLETIPSEVPYLHAEPEKVKYWKNKFTETGFKVGLVWGGRPIRANEILTLQYRSCALEYLEPLAEIDTVKLYGLQKGPPAEQIKQLSKKIIISNFGEKFEDFADTAAAIENLDLVISIDTSVAHLAGAMGKPTWALLKFDADWRWLLEREDCPWYPTMRLFRQKKNEHWNLVIKRVAEELRILTSRTANK